MIENIDALELMAALDSKADPERNLFYVDPPYMAEHRSRGVCYGHEMEDQESHERLADVLKKLRGMVVLSGYPSSLYESLYSGWVKVTRQHVANCAKITTECLWLSPNALVQPNLEGLWK